MSLELSHRPGQEVAAHYQSEISYRQGKEHVSGTLVYSGGVHNGVTTHHLEIRPKSGFGGVIVDQEISTQEGQTVKALSATVAGVVFDNDTGERISNTAARFKLRHRLYSASSGVSEGANAFGVLRAARSKKGTHFNLPKIDGIDLNSLKGRRVGSKKKERLVRGTDDVVELMLPVLSAARDLELAEKGSPLSGPQQVFSLLAEAYMSVSTLVRQRIDDAAA